MQQLKVWESSQASVIARVIANRRANEDLEDDDDEDYALVTDDVIERMEALPRSDFNVSQILSETFMDLNEVCRMLERLQQFSPSHDDKLAKLISLLTTEPLLAKHKVLVLASFAIQPATLGTN